MVLIRAVGGGWWWCDGWFCTFVSPLVNGGGCLWWIWAWVVIGGFGLVCGALGVVVVMWCEEVKGFGIR
ncbi:hypothetical protein MtrunA17_Chr1g0198591 [Medicago truncatula]|nr:hypothetical protein MtrunA17_Chr1g0198591 [Medicago truncatula]